MNGISHDGFLGGRLTIAQPVDGYRAGVDPVFLAAACPAKENDRVLELGCGVGVAGLCLAHRTRARVTGIEREEAYAALARDNAARNCVPMEIVQADLAALPADIRNTSYAHVIANPPYYKRFGRSSADNPLREVALAEETALADWLRIGAARLAPKGSYTMIQKADRLADILTAMPATMGSVQVLPLSPRDGRDAQLILLRARKGGRGALRLHAPLILHQGPHHTHDHDDYHVAIRAVLRDAAPISFPA